MGKNLSTKKKKEVELSEKVSELLYELKNQVKNIQEIYFESDPNIPSYDWLCGIRDGVRLLTSSLWEFLMKAEKVSLADLREEVESIADSIMSCAANRINSQYTLNRLPEFEWSRENWRRIKKLG